MWQPFSDEEATTMKMRVSMLSMLGMAQRTERRVIVNGSWTSLPGLEELPELFCEADNVLCMQPSIN